MISTIRKGIFMQSFIIFLQSIAPSRFEAYIYRIGAIMGAIIGFIFDGLQQAFMWLFVFMIIDYITGIMQAIHNKDLSSKIGFKGLIKKSIIVSIVILFHGLADIIQLPALETAAIFAFALNELCSIIENIERSGYADIIPPAVRKLLAICETKSEKIINDIGDPKK